MKGMVFTEFLEMVEERYSADMVEQIIAASAPPSGGAYTAIGTYDHRELGRLVAALGHATDTPVPALLRLFGQRLFGRFRDGYPMFFAGSSSSLDFLESVERHIHVEVQKLYPDAELPRFESHRDGRDRLELTYRSSRGLADFAAGLIAGCIEHFGESIDVTQEDLSGGQNTEVRFRLTRRVS